MDKEYDEMIQAASHHAKASTVCEKQHDSTITGDLAIPEDERVTVRLSPACVEQAERSVSEIDLDALSAADQILIGTRKSNYVFTVTDPIALLGKLRGGVLGKQLVDAYLLPCYVESGAATVAQKRIKSGEKFTFVIDAGKGPQRLTTSPVKSLLHRKKAGAAALLKSMPRVTPEQVSD